MNIAEIRNAYQAARAKGLRARDAAEHIGLSEGAALAAHLGNHEQPTRSVALRPDWLALLKSLQACGPLLALTRNRSVVHEKTGVYEKLSAQNEVGLALGKEIDLRLFFKQWHAGLAVTELHADADKPASSSLQFFNRHGQAVHKVFLRDSSDRAAWQAVLDQWQDPHAATPAFDPPTAIAPKTAEPAVDAAAFATSWANMSDVHQFFPLLREYGVERQHGLRLVEGRFTRRVNHGSVRQMLMEAAFDNTPIMVFVGSSGCIQIHSGPIKRVEPLEMRGQVWLNVLDPGFNLHLREDHIGTVWVVEKPSSDGTITSLEVFDQQGELMALFFGARKPGHPELTEWRHLLAHLTGVEEGSLS
ncbi:hemin-degrading factor [Serpentinimonas barnesii]|uniref:hemin-degrading factor n=1 Tax=Serpentinimonas barnesii TaxID=1458427 RepID=UPI000498522D|nr:hemin-degrading factor [Serpentinimonas barnesii]